MHLVARRTPAEAAVAAFGGLQDSAPLSGLLALHARMQGVTPTSWERPELTQVFGPRRAVWLIPVDAIAAFTLGRLPRDPEKQRRAHQIADEALAGAPDPYRRDGAVTGRFTIRWDTRTTTLVEIEPPDVEPEEARLDLARRFLAWFGESMRPQFARWAGIGAADARETLRQVAPAVRSPAKPSSGVRLLPPNDPYLYGRPKLTSAHRELPGMIVVDGLPSGTWARQGRTVTLRPAAGADLDRAVAEAEGLHQPLGGPVDIIMG